MAYYMPKGTDKQSKVSIQTEKEQKGMNKVIEPRLLSTKEACAYLSMGRNTITTFGKRALTKVGRKNYYDRLILDQEIEKARKDREGKDVDA